jgi:hypothetical protein
MNSFITGSIFIVTAITKTGRNKEEGSQGKNIEGVNKGTSE